jgi:hypothetical protein
MENKSIPVSGGLFDRMIQYASNLNQQDILITVDNWMAFFTGDFYDLEQNPEWTKDEVKNITTILKDIGITHLTLDWWNR